MDEIFCREGERGYSISIRKVGGDILEGISGGNVGGVILVGRL